MHCRFWLLACVGAALFAGSAAAAETPREEITRLVDDAVTLVQHEGLPAACAVLGQQGGKFWHDTTYVYVMSMQKRWACYPLKPALVGKSPEGIIDSTGGDLITDQLKLLNSPAGEGWVEYSWPNPVTHKLQKKESFSKRVPGTNWFIVSGYYQSAASE